MIHDVDESLRTVVRRDVLDGANVEISFEAPTREWAARRNSPTLSLYLYEIREDLQRREVQFEERRGPEGVVIEPSCTAAAKRLIADNVSRISAAISGEGARSGARSQ